MRVCILENGSVHSRMYLLSWLYEKKDVEEITFIKNKMQFMESAEKDPPDIAFIQLSNDDPVGLSMIDKLHKSGENTEVVFISEGDGYALEAYNTGASGYLVEPLERKRFESCFSKLLHVKRQMKAF
ncbi:MAG: response regulator [Deltaproteobacteria bacterium]|nr:response regulator [Deltaproteobacteria bacterium]